MNKVIFGLVLTVSMAGFAKELSPEIIKQGKANMELINNRLGGFVGDKRHAEGSIVIVDAQGQIDTNTVFKHSRKIEFTLGMAVTYSKWTNGPVDFLSLGAAKLTTPGNLWIVLTELPSFPALISLPEQRTVFVNVSALALDKPDVKVLESRVVKEMSRAVCFAFVVKYSSKSGGVMDPIETVKDLDRMLVDIMGVDCKANIEKSGSLNFGIKRFPRKTYLDACKEGWAPPPKTEAQKKIWNDVHSAPANPMKIEFDPKKGR